MLSLSAHWGERVASVASGRGGHARSKKHGDTEAHLTLPIADAIGPSRPIAFAIEPFGANRKERMAGAAPLPASRGEG